MCTASIWKDHELNLIVSFLLLLSSLSVLAISLEQSCSWSTFWRLRIFQPRLKLEEESLCGHDSPTSSADRRRGDWDWEREETEKECKRLLEIADHFSFFLIIAEGQDCRTQDGPSDPYTQETRVRKNRMLIDWLPLVRETDQETSLRRSLMARRWWGERWMGKMIWNLIRRSPRVRWSFVRGMPCPGMIFSNPGWMISPSMLQFIFSPPSNRKEKECPVRAFRRGTSILRTRSLPTLL